MLPEILNYRISASVDNCHSLIYTSRSPTSSVIVAGTAPDVIGWRVVWLFYNKIVADFSVAIGVPLYQSETRNTNREVQNRF